MSQIKDIFSKHPEPTTRLNKGQLSFLIMLGQMDQTQVFNQEVIEEWSKPGHDRRKQVKKALSDRKFKYLFEFHNRHFSDIPVAFPYLLWICGISKRKVDVAVYHSYIMMKAIEADAKLIDVDFISTQAMTIGIWENKQVKAIWSEQKQNGENIFDKGESWEELRNEK